MELEESNLPQPPAIVDRPVKLGSEAAAETCVAPLVLPQVKLRIANVESTDGLSGGRFVGNYVLDPVAGRNAPQRWELNFPAHCGLFKAELVATPLEGGGQRLLARLSGLENGPEWSGETARFEAPTVLRSAPERVGRAIAGCFWPSHVIVTPLIHADGRDWWHIPPEATLEELLILSGIQETDGSFDPNLSPLGSGVNDPELIIIWTAGSGGCDAVENSLSPDTDFGSGMS
jgi:hypothetical protein